MVTEEQRWKEVAARYANALQQLNMIARHQTNRFADDDVVSFAGADSNPVVRFLGMEPQEYESAFAENPPCYGYASGQRSKAKARQLREIVKACFNKAKLTPGQQRLLKLTDMTEKLNGQKWR